MSFLNLTRKSNGSRMAKSTKPDKKRGIQPKVEGTKHSLTIPKTDKDDTAEYSVKIGAEETKGKLMVEGRLRSIGSTRT